jgi:hypothetical protein
MRDPRARCTTSDRELFVDQPFISDSDRAARDTELRGKIAPGWQTGCDR